MKFLKNIRVILSLLFFLPILLFFIDITGKLPLQLHTLMKLQWVPAILSLDLILIGILFILSLLFGRIYCSTICPLGVFQDISARMPRFFRKKNKKFRYKYMKPQNILRYSILAITVLLFVFDSSLLLILLDPYSVFGRIVSQLIRPLVIWGNNGLSSVLSGMGNYSLSKVDFAGFVPLAFGISLFFFILVGVMSWLRGRLYCNTVCPVGTTLGLLSKISIFHISIKESSCTQCGLCEKSCKSQCIDSKVMKVDNTRCVSCFNCISACKKGSMKYELRYRKPKAEPVQRTIDNSRRTFLLTSGAIMSTLAFANVNVNKIVSGKKDAMLARRPVMPPGAHTIGHFNAHCTGCQLCVSKCPMHVLKPAALQYGISGIMQPHLEFSTDIFCDYNCNICSQVCPTGALRPLPVEEKKLVQIGSARFRKDKCVVFKYEKDCGACSEHCPTQAVHMIPYKNGLTIPEVTEDICIGCGGCESICPAQPYRAIYVEGTTTQITAKKPTDAKKFDKVINNFGF
jgi:ferredoxin